MSVVTVATTHIYSFFFSKAEFLQVILNSGVFFSTDCAANNALLGRGVGLGLGLENKERTKGDQRHY